LYRRLHFGVKPRDLVDQGSAQLHELGGRAARVIFLLRLLICFQASGRRRDVDGAVITTHDHRANTAAVELASLTHLVKVTAAFGAGWGSFSGAPVDELEDAFPLPLVVRH
jgi:hypothetical protein